MVFHQQIRRILPGFVVVFSAQAEQRAESFVVKRRHGRGRTEVDSDGTQAFETFEMGNRIAKSKRYGSMPCHHASVIRERKFMFHDHI